MAALEGLIGGALARELAARRVSFNARFAAARMGAPAPDPAEFAAHLRLGLAPVADAVAAARPDSVSAAVDALYDSSLELVAKGLLGPGARRPAVDAAWRRLLCSAPKLTAAEPRDFSAAVVNACWNVDAAPGARTEDWTERAAALAPLCADLAQFRAAGAVAAWTCGVAALRAAALAAAGELPEALARAALLLPPSAPSAREALARLAEDPWLAPRDFASPAPPRSLRVVAEAGSFRGFGGEFRVPPRVFAEGFALYARDDERLWRVRADAFGAALTLEGPAREAAPSPASAFALSTDGTAARAGASARFPELARPSSQAADGATLAATLPQSHRIFLIALASEEKS